MDVLIPNAVVAVGSGGHDRSFRCRPRGEASPAGARLLRVRHSALPSPEPLVLPNRDAIYFVCRASSEGITHAPPSLVCVFLPTYLLPSRPRRCENIGMCV
jgi:hypothetical protein